MSQPLECTFDKNYLSKATILYIETDENIRENASSIFAGFFKKVLVCQNIDEAQRVFIDNQLEIDIVLLDVDIPDLGGIKLLSKIRELDWDLPVLITTSFNEINLLLKAIKFNLTNYIAKPMQLNTTLKIMSDTIKKIEDEKELAIKNNELRQFMSILDSNNIICELDLNFKIDSANDLFLINSGFDLDEIIGKEFNDKIIFHNSDISDFEIKELLTKGKTWVGLCKKKTKDGEFYNTYSTILPIFHNNGKVKKYIEFSTLTTKYEKEILSLKKHIMSLKSENFKTNSELRKEKDYYITLSDKLQKQVDDSVNSAQGVVFELYEAKKKNNKLLEKLKIQEQRFDEFQASVLCG